MRYFLNSPAPSLGKGTDRSKAKKCNGPFRTIQYSVTVIALLCSFASFAQNIENSMMENLEPMSVSSYSHLQVSDLNANNLQLPANWNHKLPPRPPINPSRSWGELFAGIGAGFIGVIASSVIVGIIGNNQTNTYISATIGYTTYATSTALGIYLVGSIGNQAGSYWSALAGSAVGMGSIGIPSLIASGEIDTDKLSFYLMPLASTIGGVVGFNLSRKYEDDSELSLNPTANGVKLTYEF